MQFAFTLQYRDHLEAARATFPGERPVARPRPAGVALVAAVVLAAGVYVLLSRMPAVCRAAAPAVAGDAAGPVSEAMDHPVFGAGALIAALGGIVYVAPLAYVISMRRSARPVHDEPVTALFDEHGVAVRSAAKDFFLDWDGVVAVSESPRLFVLKTVSDLRLVLPKRALEKAVDVDALRDLLRQRVPAMAEAVAA